jgi:FkbM family methyltransferase
VTSVSPYYAQFGEDRAIHKLFGGKSDGICIEVGANDGFHGSNTLFFERLGWACVLVEPNPDLARLLRKTRTGKVFECAASSIEGSATLQLAEGDPLAHAVSTIGSDERARASVRAHGFRSRPVEVRTRRLDDILSDAGVAPGFEFMTLDVEGHELEALNGLSLDQWKPQLVIVEDNSRLGDGPVRRHLARAGYVPFHRTGVNDWYAHHANHPILPGNRWLHYAKAVVSARARMTLSKLAGAIARIPGTRRAVRSVRNLLGTGRRS